MPASGILLEQVLERLVRLRAAAERRERLAQLLVRKRQSRLELDGALEARHRLLEAPLQRQHAAEVLVQVRESGRSESARRTVSSASA